MERYAKGFRSFGGFLILLNAISFFLPLTECIQEGYATLRWSQFHYVNALLHRSLPYIGERSVPVTEIQTAVILGCMALPLILALAAGVWGLFGSFSQRGSSVMIFLVLILYIALGVSVHILWPREQLGQTYKIGIASITSIIISGCSAIVSILAVASTPKRIKKVEKKIPQVEEIKQQQTEARYNIIINGEIQNSQIQQLETKKANTPGDPRGVMVGLAGVYVGAEIPMPDGEFIELGRQNTNHLVFEGQEKVSRDHCKIKWNAADKKYIICDYSSTGSFVNGSQDCLPQNLELMLEPGTVVAIGDEANTFRLE